MNLKILVSRAHWVERCELSSLFSPSALSGDFSLKHGPCPTLLTVVALSRRHHSDLHQQHLKINHHADRYTAGRRNIQSRLGRKRFKSSKVEFLLHFPTCPCPPRAVSTWRGDHCGPHLQPLLGDASSGGAAACTRHLWGRNLSWQSQGKPECASSCTVRAKKQRNVGKGSESPTGRRGFQSWAPSGCTDTLLKEEKDMLVLPSPYQNMIRCQILIKK